ncbi:MAG: Hpt domain-containing protein [Pirellulales bacterium]|nr:Hpt domain-containing protein [Pirellulales bacterium]
MQHKGSAVMEGSGASKQACNPQVAIERLGGDVEIYKDLLYALFQGVSGQYAALETAVQNDDAAAMHYSAHAVKGLAATCGAERVAECAHELEDLGRARVTTGAQKVLSDLQHAMQSAEQELATYLDRGASSR